MRASASPTDVPRGAARHSPAARQQLRASFALSLASAFVLNAIAIGVFATVVTHWQAPAGAAHRTAWITAVEIERPAAQEIGEPAAPSQTAVPLPKANAPTSAQPRIPLVQTPTPTNVSEDGAETRFYKFREVEQAAEPDSDWNLDSATLDATGIDKLVFDIFIGRSGEVVSCTVIEPATLTADVRKALEDRLRQTALRPALRGGVAVASMRRIEVSVQSSAQ